MRRFDQKPAKPQQDDDDASFRPTPLESDTLGSPTTIGTTEEAHAELWQGFSNGVLYAKLQSPKQKVKDIGALQNQRTLKEAGFTAVDKPGAKRHNPKGPQAADTTNRAGNALGMRPATPTMISDDESLPEDAVMYFSGNQTSEKKVCASTSEQIQNLVRDAGSETPTKKRRTTGPSIVRFSNTINAREPRTRQLPDRAMHAEGNRTESALSPRSPELQPLERPLPNQISITKPSVEDSLGSPMQREKQGVVSAVRSEASAEFSAQLAEPKPGKLDPRPGYQCEDTEPSVAVRPLGGNRIGNGNEPNDQSTSHNFVNFWILKAYKPFIKWRNWADATLDHETVDSIFDAFSRFTGDQACDTIDVQLQTPREEYTFQIHKEDGARFDAKRASMLRIVKAVSHNEESHSRSVDIYLRPGRNPTSEF